MSAGPDYCKLGAWEFPSAEAPRVSVKVEIGGKGKVEKKESDGKSDAVTTFKGASPADVTITLTWLEWTAVDGQTPEDVYVRKALKEFSPRGPKKGEPWELTHVDADLYDVASVLFEDLSLKREDGSNKITATLKGASWVKPAPKAAGAGSAKTTDKANEWTLGAGDKSRVDPNWSDSKKKFGGTSPPTVKP